MPISAKSARIGGASLIAVLMVAGGYALPGFQFPETRPVNAELTDDILAEYVAKDTDADGLPDWQEVLYGTNPNVADTDSDGISDGEAVRRGLLTPTSLSSQIPADPIGEEDIPGEGPATGSFTERFGRSFFEAYIQASGGQKMTPEEQEALINELLASYTNEAARSLIPSYTRVSIRTDNTSSNTAYAGSVELLFGNAVPDAPDSDMFVLAERIVANEDAAAVARLETLGNQYLKAASDLLQTPAPASQIDNHLRLVRGLEQAGRAAKAISSYKDDPLLTMGGLAVLLPARTEIMQAFSGIAQGVLIEGEPAPGSPGADIVAAVRREQQR